MIAPPPCPNCGGTVRTLLGEAGATVWCRCGWSERWEFDPANHAVAVRVPNVEEEKP